MSLTLAQIATLKTELQTDPRGYGYAAAITAGSDNALVAAVNLTRDGTAGTVPANPTAAGGVASGIISVRRNDISGAEILQATDPVTDQATTVTNLQAAYFNATSTMRTLSFVNADGSDNAVLKNLKQCFTANSASRTALGAISKRNGSRAEELFVAGTVVSGDDVSLALRGH